MHHAKGGKATSPTPIDVNRHAVKAALCAGEWRVVIQRPPRMLTRAEALVFAGFVTEAAEEVERRRNADKARAVAERVRGL